MSAFRDARVKMGLSQKQLAAVFGTSQPIVSGWENGTRPIPRERLADIAATMDVDARLLELSCMGDVPAELRARVRAHAVEVLAFLEGLDTDDIFAM